jgi:hypothetical protein
MKWDAPVSRTRPAASSSVQLGLLAAGNLLAAVGGGRVTSAAKGVAGLTMLGSGSLLAFLFGSAVGLALVVVVRRCPLGRTLVGLSLAAVASSCVLIAILWLDAYARRNIGVLTVQNTGQATLSGAMAWLFFLGLVVRYALWFAGRSLRSDLAALQQVSWLAVAESAYFLGFIIGLLIGSVAIEGCGGVVGALLLDLLLLCVVAGCDLWHRRPIAPARQPTNPRYRSANVVLSKTSFWLLTAGFGASTIACQIVIFHVVDALARTGASTHPAWADVTLATFYLGVAVAAALCAWVRPTLEHVNQGTSRIVWQSARPAVRLPLVLLVTLAGVLILSGLFGIIHTATSVDMPSPWSAGGVLALAALGVGSGFFELLVLTILGRIRYGGSGAVALAFGLVVTAATIVLLLMMLGGMQFLGEAVMTVTGLALTAWLVQQVKNPNGWDGSHG